MHYGLTRGTLSDYLAYETDRAGRSCRPGNPAYQDSAFASFSCIPIPGLQSCTSICKLTDETLRATARSAANQLRPRSPTKHTNVIPSCDLLQCPKTPISFTPHGPHHAVLDSNPPPHLSRNPTNLDRPARSLSRTKRRNPHPALTRRFPPPHLSAPLTILHVREARFDTRDAKSARRWYCMSEHEEVAACRAILRPSME